MAPRKKTNRKTASAPTSRQRAIKNGYRSGLEDKTARQIKESGLEVLYETERIQFVWPERQAHYTPDFRLPKPGGYFYVETKGQWQTEDRHKHLLIRQQCPDIDIRLVFSNANAKLYKGSPTTYAAYCEKHGIQYAHKVIPEDWLLESKDATIENNNGDLGSGE